MRSHHLTAMALLLMAMLPLQATAQRRDEPKRPALPAAADTNDPRAYYLLGESLLAVQPDRAADAFYWATRLDPSSADFLYARRTALLMKDPRRLVRYLDGDRRTLRNREVLAIDSLQIGAFMTNPFLYRRFEKKMHDAYVKELFSGAAMSTRYTQAEIDHAYDRYLQNAGPATAGWIAYADGRFDEALARYAQALASTKRKAYLRTERGRIFQMTGNADSALAMLRLAGEELRDKDNKEIVFVYDSKALLEYSIGKIHEAADRVDDAREAYARALQEDLAFYPAHVALASLALAARDTATVAGEMELAVQLRPQDPVIRLLYGYSLATLGQAEPAIEQLEKAIALEPLFARPYRVLAEVHDRAGDHPRAMARYEEFLTRSAKTAPDYAEAAARLAQLRKAGGS